MLVVVEVHILAQFRILFLLRIVAKILHLEHLLQRVVAMLGLGDQVMVFCVEVTAVLVGAVRDILLTHNKGQEQVEQELNHNNQAILELMVLVMMVEMQLVRLAHLMLVPVVVVLEVVELVELKVLLPEMGALESHTQFLVHL